MIKISGFEHVSIASDELEPSARILALFGIEKSGFEELHTQHVSSTYFEEPATGVRFEVIKPGSEDSHLHKFLKDRGPGLHHVCLQVEDLDDACKQVIAAGGRIVGEVFSDSRGRHAFIHPKSTGGVLIGMIELHPQFRNV